MSDPFGNAFAMSILAATTVDELKASHGDAFLVVQGKQLSARELDDDTSQHDITVPGSDKSSKPMPTRGLVYVLARKPTSQFDWISIGRHENNDVHMPHGSVSRFHALIREDRGVYTVQDAKSANGSFVANEPVRAHGSGDGTVLRPNVEVRFGDIITIFLDAAGLFVLASRTRSRGPMAGVG